MVIEPGTSHLITSTTTTTRRPSSHNKQQSHMTVELGSSFVETRDFKIQMDDETVKVSICE